jgi:ribonuclease P protein component
MGLGCGWLLNGDVKFLAAAAKRDANGLPSSCRLNTPARKPFGFPRSSRLTREADLESVRRTGKRMQTERLEARASASLLPHPRVGVVVPKFRRNIVDRNRTKRQLRELARTRILPLAGRIDVLLRAKPEAYGATFDQLTVEVDAIAWWAAGIASH